jgi:hypothetical protein
MSLVRYLREYRTTYHASYFDLTLQLCPSITSSESVHIFWAALQFEVPRLLLSAPYFLRCIFVADRNLLSVLYAPLIPLSSQNLIFLSISLIIHHIEKCLE